MASSCTGTTVTRETSPPGQVSTMAMCPHKARLLVGVELCLIAGSGFGGDHMYVTSGVWSGDPIVCLGKG